MLKNGQKWRNTAENDWKRQKNGVIKVKTKLDYALIIPPGRCYTEAHLENQGAYSLRSLTAPWFSRWASVTYLYFANIPPCLSIDPVPAMGVGSRVPYPHAYPRRQNSLPPCIPTDTTHPTPHVYPSYSSPYLYGLPWPYLRYIQPQFWYKHT